jgi:hypothetical protein
VTTDPVSLRRTNDRGIEPQNAARCGTDQTLGPSNRRLARESAHFLPLSARNPKEEVPVRLCCGSALMGGR